MKASLKFLSILILIVAFTSCNKNKEQQPEARTATTTLEPLESKNKGQAFIEDDVAIPNILQIAMGSKDHSTLVAAVQAAQLENSLVNAGPLMVFAPTNAAFEALPAGTVEDLLKPENKNVLADILKYHVTPGNYSKEFLTKFKKLGQANNQDVQIEVIDGEPMVGGAKIIASLPAGNGIVHVIDKVLLPPNKNN